MGSTNAGAEAAAKAGESGAAGGSGSAGCDHGYSIHMITDTGVSATATAGVIRVRPVKLKE